MENYMSNKCIVESCNEPVTTAAVCEWHLHRPSHIPKPNPAPQPPETKEDEK